MKEFWNTVQLVFAGIGGWLGWFLGGCDGLLYALTAFAAIDYITGVMCAVTDKRLSSEAGFRGIFKKALIFLLVGAANILDAHVIGTGCVLRTAIIFFLHLQRGREPPGECRAPRPPGTGEAERDAGAAAWQGRKRGRRRMIMKLVESLMKRNPCYTAGRKITVRGLMLHSVGCPQPDASIFINSWNSPLHKSACVHAFIDGNDGTAYQTLPWNHRGWHCGSGSRGSANNTHIGVEMCEPACIRYTPDSKFTCPDTASAKAAVKRTYETAVELFAMLCRKYGLDPLTDGVIISHREGCARGTASNHGDPEHLWTQLGTGYTMDGFRRAVRAEMDGRRKPAGKALFRVRKKWADAASQKGAFQDLSNAEKCADKNPGYSVFDESGKAVYKGKSRRK